MTQTRLAVIYYSSTGSVHRLAERAAETAANAGAEVRLRRAAELAPQQVIDRVPAWAAHAAATTDIEVAAPDDAAWADAVLFGTPVRFGNVASQLKQYIDTLGGLWAEGRLADKVYAGFSSGGTGGTEATLLALYNCVHHMGGVLVPPGYTDPIKFVDGNPYGAANLSGADGSELPGKVELTAVDHLTERVLRFARLVRRPAA
ncbi:NAD(P)H:quinone oxidoreductase [Actinopolymorpha sp. B17G11]|uniref:NAD(P)H:quinone oxidoreductase n=1 Tax=unclassified Actinopolymorpha TaxID=2627063 RepID=UPI0032D90A2D